MAWDRFLDQDKIISILRSYIELDQVSGSFIFSGLKGVGKFSIAKEFSKSVNCLQSAGDSCSVCQNCVQIEREFHPDFYIVRPAEKSGEITIDMIRELQRFLNLSPANARKKFFIIDQAEKMNIESANAFLKSLEEPPLDSVIILVSSRPGALIATIKSRCKELKFRPLSKKTIGILLRDKFELTIEESARISALSEGGLDFDLEGIDLTGIETTLKEFFRFPRFKERGDKNLLHQQRERLKDKIRILILYIRDILCIVNEVDSLSVFPSLDNRDKVINIESKDLIEKIDKLEYLYSALGSNVNPDFIYKVVRNLYKEVELKSEIHS
ncbi:MAG: DNA polymerase III subunit delta' [Candidatus Kaelpia imicola]|nr:DNA polymerase III subunit delta' [Candidatus Kaelpia imicola]